MNGKEKTYLKGDKENPDADYPAVCAERLGLGGAHRLGASAHRAAVAGSEADERSQSTVEQQSRVAAKWK